MKNKLILIIAVMTALNFSCKKEDEKTYPVDGLVSYFKFDDNLNDQLGNTSAGVNYNNSTFTSGQAGKAITFDGTSQYIEFDRSSFRNGNNVSVSLWLKCSATSGLYLLMCDDFGVFAKGTEAGMAISLPGTNSAIGTVTAGEWTHLVGTYDGTTIKAYINGVLADEVSHPGNIAPFYGKMDIGKFSNAFWKGSVDDLFIYNKVLTQAEVDMLYNYHK